MESILIAMILALLIPIYEACHDKDIWQKMLAFASIATKTSIIMLFIKNKTIARLNFVHHQTRSP